MTASELPLANWVERRALDVFRYHKRSCTVADTAEESYLRLDISCGSPTCAVCQGTLTSLPVSPRHLLLPDAAVLAAYLDAFELPEVDGMVLLTSVVRQLHDGGNMRRSARLRTLYTDVRRRNVLFDNLHHRDTAPCSLQQQRVALLTTADWYYEHLGRRLPVVVVSDELAAQLGVQDGMARLQGSRVQQQQQAAYQQRNRQGRFPPVGAGDLDDPELDALLNQMHIGSTGNDGGAVSDVASFLDGLGIGGEEPDRQPPEQPQQQRQEADLQQKIVSRGSRAAMELEPGVHVLSAADYFAGCWGHAPAVVDVFDSIQQSKTEEQADGGTSGASFRPHMTAAAMDAGLAAGTLLAGTVAASKRVRGEATVAVNGGRNLLLVGRAAMNRAVHGDRVAVRLLPREQWRPAAAGGSTVGFPGAADSEEAAEECEEEDEHELLAAAGDGKADVAADEAGGGSIDKNTPDALAQLLGSAGGPADALQPTAEVVGVLQRWSGEVVACISEEDERALAAARHDTGRQEAVLCVPVDRRLPKIRLRSRQLHNLLGQRLVLRLDGWDRSSRYPHGHLVRSLGPINCLASETDGVLVSSGVHWQPFSEGALRELPQIRSSTEYVFPASELAARRDLRGPEYLICSIDPPGCTDVDDALSVRWLDEDASGRQLVEVGVHIADVSYFVRQGGQLDSEAASRCTTVYLVDRRLDMLPALLSEDLCSLRAGHERYAVSVLWTLEADSLQVVDTWFGRTLIRSSYQLEYSQAEAIMHGRPQPLQAPRADGRSGGTGEVAVPPRDLPRLRRNLRLLAALAEQRRMLRLQAGAVELESAELRFKTDAGGQPTAVTVKQEIDMMRIVAEMMVSANAAVGERIFQAFPRAALLRRHPPPRREAFAEVAALCESLGSPLDFDSGPAGLATSLASAAAAAPPALASLIKSLATRAMSEAEYFCTGDVTGRGGAGMSHFGLALPYYTHFTSPIRRYADVVVHRQLLAGVAAPSNSAATTESAAPSALDVPGPAAVPPPLAGPEVAERAAVMNDRHRTAKRAQKECSDLYLLLLLHAQPHVESATIYSLRPSALLVFVPKYHLKGVIHLTDKSGVCKPPLRGAGDERLEDPYVLAYRRGLALVADGGSSSIGDRAGGGAPQQVSIVEAGGGAPVVTYRPMQRVWVQLSADGSRAHGPRLRLQLLHDEHPAALEAVRKEAAASSAQSAPAPRETASHCLSQPQAAARPAYQPSSVAAAAKGPPPGFGLAASAAEAPRPSARDQVSQAAGGQQPSAVSASTAPEPPELASLAARLQAFLDQQQQPRPEGGGTLAAAEGCALAAQATLPPLEQFSSSGGGGSCTGMTDSSCQVVVHRALRQLRARAARLELKTGASAIAAARVRQQIKALQHLVPR